MAYDTYGDQIQLKSGPCEYNHYEIGDDVPISDGVHFDRSGFVVVQNGKLIAEVEQYKDCGCHASTVQNVCSVCGKQAIWKEEIPVFDKYGGNMTGMLQRLFDHVAGENPIL